VVSAFGRAGSVWVRRRTKREDHRVTTLGAIFLPQLPPKRLRSVARMADEAGLAELWLWEDCFLESGIATAPRRSPGPNA